MIGTEWFPYAAKATDDSNPNMAPYAGEYLRSTADATPFERRYDGFDLSVSHDETYLYLLMVKRHGDWNFSKDEVDVGFGTLGEGSTSANPAPGLSFPDGGVHFLLQILLQMKCVQDSRMLVNSAYDQHSWLWGYRYHYIPYTASHDASAGEFLPWNLALNRE
jgi:hypothetical protein